MANSATKIIPDSLIAQKQNTKNIRDSIQVALSDSVLIHINAGGSRSGDFVDLNNKNLRIAIQGAAQTIPLSKIKKVEFEEGVWIPASNTEICQNSYRNCRKFRGSDGHRSGEAVTLNNIGGVYDNIGKPTEALDYLNQALPIRREVGHRSGEATTLNNIGVVYRNIGKPTEAINALEAARFQWTRNQWYCLSF